MPRPEVLIMLIVLILSSLWNLVYAVGVGLVIASLMFMKKMGDVTAQESDVKPLSEEKSLAVEENFVGIHRRITTRTLVNLGLINHVF